VVLKTCDEVHSGAVIQGSREIYSWKKTFSEKKYCREIHQAFPENAWKNFCAYFFSFIYGGKVAED